MPFLGTCQTRPKRRPSFRACCLRYPLGKPFPQTWRKTSRRCRQSPCQWRSDNPAVQAVLCTLRFPCRTCPAARPAFPGFWQRHRWSFLAPRCPYPCLRPAAPGLPCPPLRPLRLSCAFRCPCRSWQRPCPPALPSGRCSTALLSSCSTPYGIGFLGRCRDRPACTFRLADSQFLYKIRISGFYHLHRTRLFPRLVDFCSLPRNPVDKLLVFAPCPIKRKPAIRKTAFIEKCVYNFMP